MRYQPIEKSLQADNTDGTYMRMVTVLVAVIFIVVGIFTLMQV